MSSETSAEIRDRDAESLATIAQTVAIRRYREDDVHYWQDDANCLGVDPDLFFPERGASTREAKEVCRGCVVRMDCLEFALASGEKFGIWGGLSERERRRLRRQRSRRVGASATTSTITDANVGEF